MGYFGGIPFVNRYGKFFFMKEEDIKKCNNWFEKYNPLEFSGGQWLGLCASNAGTQF